MKYFLAKNVSQSYDDAITAVTEALKGEGFGVLTEIDVAQTLKKKLDVDFPKYKILGACNPDLAHKALNAENQIGVLLPCNVVVQEHADGRVEVSAMDPAAAMQAIGNSELDKIASDVRQRLEKVLSQIS
ncbi:MAG: DUF302 domain-containing protein [Hyphomicrobiaceae bacterium]|nr:DUF302 domain-containing protein [Hyphomicrobiaceae bacterium]MCC0011443.1 DUF302 domain-containing protein [Hyphomicrobiaceae bacterium]